MITLKKIATLKPRVQLRRIGNIFHQAQSGEIDHGYLEAIYEYLIKGNLIVEADKKAIIKFFTSETSLRFDDIYYHILNILGESPADWDFTDEEGKLDLNKRVIKEHYLYLDHIRSPYNVGSIFRSAESFGIREIYLSEGSASAEHERARRTSRSTVDIIPHKEISLEELSLPVFALELGGKDISEFEFPQKGICIIGSEEDGVSKEALNKADCSLGRVSIKQYGAKGSINVASATAIMLYEWMNALLD